MPLKEKYKRIQKEMQSKYGKDKGEKIFWAWVNKEEKDVEVKSYFFVSEELKSVEDDVVEGYVATGYPDSYNDILTEECLADMVAQIKSLPITIDDNHESFKDQNEGEKFRSFNPLAKIVDASLEGTRVKVKSVLNKANARYEEIKSSIKEGFLHSFSFAFIPVDKKSVSIDGEEFRVLNKVRLLNACFTGIPVNSEAKFSNVMLKSLVESSDYDDAEVKEIIKGVESMEDEKKEVVEETPKVEETPVEAPVEESALVENSISKEEVKSLEDKIVALEKEISELKSEESDEGKEEAVEEPKEEPKEDAEVKALREEVAELKAKLEEPQMKARVEPKEVEVDAEVKSRGPLDFIN